MKWGFITSISKYVFKNWYSSSILWMSSKSIYYWDTHTIYTLHVLNEIIYISKINKNKRFYLLQYPRHHITPNITNPTTNTTNRTMIKINHQVTSHLNPLQYDIESQSLSNTHTKSGSINRGPFPESSFPFDGIP